MGANETARPHRGVAASRFHRPPERRQTSVHDARGPRPDDSIPHRRDIGVELLAVILRQAGIPKGLGTRLTTVFMDLPRRTLTLVFNALLAGKEGDAFSQASRRARGVVSNFWLRRIPYAICTGLFLWMAARVRGASDGRRAA